MSSATTKRKAKTDQFSGLRCPLCGDEEMYIKVEDLTIECRGCCEEVTREQVEVMIEKWGRLLAWIDSATNTEA